MSIRDRLRSSLQKDGQKSKSGTWHSKAYHRFFEGYSEITVPNSNGKGYKIQRIYKGDYYRQDLTKGRRILIRVLYILFFLCAAYLFISSAILPLASNSTWYVVFSQVLSIPFLFWIVIAFFSYLPAKQDMTIDEYRSSSLSLQKAALGSVVCLGITALTTLVYIVLHPLVKSQQELLCCGKYIAAGLLTLAMYRIEKKVNYLTIPNAQHPPENSFEINSGANQW